MRNHIITEIALGLGMVSIAIFLMTQPAVAAGSATSSSHGPTLGPSGGNLSGPVSGSGDNTVKGNPVIHPNTKPVKTERQCQRNCARGGMTRDFCLLACAGY